MGRVRNLGEADVRIVPDEPQIDGPGGEIPQVIIDAQLETARQRRAEEKISLKLASLNNAPGAPVGELVGSGGSYYRQFHDGGIYCNLLDDATFWVHGWIGQRYAELRGPDSWLGWPTSDEQDFPEAGRVSTFKNGAIYWWADTGPRDLNNVTVHYTGLHCFGETDVDQVWSTDDEPYATIGVAGPDGSSGTFRSQIYDAVNGGDERIEVIEIYHGQPRGLVISAVLQEHSGGDTELSRKVVKEAVEKGGTALAASATLIPVVGPVLGPLFTAAHQMIKDDIAGALNDFIENTLGMADRPLGTDLIELTPKQMVVLATRPEGHVQYGQIPWRFETKQLSRFGASYKIYFNIFAA